MPSASVIIPCFNHGEYIHEAIDSVLVQTCQDFEIIIVDDGSTEPRTIDILDRIKHSKIRVIHTSNQGLASARNNGIREAQAAIILPLDSDDKIEPTYIEKALEVFQKDPDVGIVYCYVDLFGEKRGRWNLPEFSVNAILFRNLIFHCSFFRRSDWERVKGYNSNMKYGWEDWDFWLSIVSLGKKVYRIPEVLHLYRVRGKSMVHLMTSEQKSAMHARLFLNHPELYHEHLQEFFGEIHRLQTKSERSVIEVLLMDKLFHPIKSLYNLRHRFDTSP